MKDLALRRLGEVGAAAALREFLGLIGRPKDEASWTTRADELVEIPGHGQRKIAIALNFVGDTCLRINLVTKRALAYCMAGDVIEIVTDNLSSVETIPFMSPNYDFIHLATVQEQMCWKIYLGKTNADPFTVQGRRM
jgi:TusA-related sulfurtransferase